MKNIRYFKTPQEQKEFIYKNIITLPEIQEHPFYEKLIAFVINEKSPLFFTPHKDYERAHFTQYFNYYAIRPYDNSALSTLYYIHDFTHMLFKYPMQPHKQFFENFLHTAIYNEYVASNDSEILTYYRLPSLRKKTFEQTILYDHLVKQYPTPPSTQELVTIRKKCVLDGYIHINWKKIADESITFLQQFKSSNVTRCKLWYDSFPILSSIPRQKTFSRYNYQEQLENYVPHRDTKKYQQNVLNNVKLGLQLLWHKKFPKHFEEIDDYLPLLENQIIMNDTAEEFHKAYHAMKAKAALEYKGQASLVWNKKTQNY